MNYKEWQQNNTTTKPLNQNKIMTPKEKAEELVDKFIEHTRVFHEVLGWEDYIDSAKQCALIAVDEIAKCTKYEEQKFDNDRFAEDFWQEVKQEIEKS